MLDKAPDKVADKNFFAENLGTGRPPHPTKNRRPPTNHRAVALFPPFPSPKHQPPTRRTTSFEAAASAERSARDDSNRIEFIEARERNVPPCLIL